MTAQQPRPADSRVVSPAFIALAIATLAFFVAGGIVLPVASLYAKGPLRTDAAGVGVALGSFSIAALVMRPFVGWASDRFGRRPLLIVGSAVTIVALLLHLWATTVALFIAVRALLGIGEAFFFVAALAAAADLAPANRRGEAISFLSLSLYLGLAIGPVLGETVLRLTSYTGVWILAAAVAGLAAGLSWVTPETAPALERGQPSQAGGGRLIHPAGIFPGLLIMSGIWGMAGFLVFVPLHAQTLGLDGAGSALALFAGIVVGLRIFGAKLPDRIGAARLSGAALAVSALGLALLGLLPGIAGLFVGTSVLAVGVAFTFPALMALAVSRVPPAERGSVVGTASAFLDLAFGIAPASLGLIADASGYAGAFVVSAVIAAAGSVLLVIRRDAARVDEAKAGPPGDVATA
jgi:MFS family permease